MQRHLCGGPYQWANVVDKRFQAVAATRCGNISMPYCKLEVADLAIVRRCARAIVSAHSSAFWYRAVRFFLRGRERTARAGWRGVTRFDDGAAFRLRRRLRYRNRATEQRDCDHRRRCEFQYFVARAAPPRATFKSSGR